MQHLLILVVHSHAGNRMARVNCRGRVNVGDDLFVVLLLSLSVKGEGNMSVRGIKCVQVVRGWYNSLC